MSKKRKKRIQVVRAEIPTVRISVEKVLEALESEELRKRLGEICNGCQKKCDTKKIGDEFLCRDCREERMEIENEH